MYGACLTSGKPRDLSRKLRWRDLYNETLLYKCAVRLYTKPLFSWRKALATSTDGKDLYDFARRGPQNLEAIHRSLKSERFAFRPGTALHKVFRGKERTLYIFPWEERLVDLLLYRALSMHLQNDFSVNSYAYRIRGFGLDRCQRGVARKLAESTQPLYVVKRDIARYFPSVDHARLSSLVGGLVDEDDYLMQLLAQRIRFQFVDSSELQIASVGIPFGTAIACFFANLYLTPLDRRLDAVPGLHYFRYADDLLFFSQSQESVEAGKRHFDAFLAEARLESKPSHELNVLLGSRGIGMPDFLPARSVRHLGLEFCIDGTVRLSRDKCRKLMNLFRFAFRKKRPKLRRIIDPQKRANLLVQVAASVVSASVRNVSIIDYYLKHVSDESQLRAIDRWLAEEVLALTFQRGHKKGMFRLLPYARLRTMGLPSLVYRRRQIRSGQIEAPFFVWKSYKRQQVSRETAARPRQEQSVSATFSPSPEAVTSALIDEDLVGEGRHL